VLPAFVIIQTAHTRQSPVNLRGEVTTASGLLQTHDVIMPSSDIGGKDASRAAAMEFGHQEMVKQSDGANPASEGKRRVGG